MRVSYMQIKSKLCRHYSSLEAMEDMLLANITVLPGNECSPHLQHMQGKVYIYICNTTHTMYFPILKSILCRVGVMMKNGYKLSETVGKVVSIHLVRVMNTTTRAFLSGHAYHFKASDVC